MRRKRSFDFPTVDLHFETPLSTFQDTGREKKSTQSGHAWNKTCARFALRIIQWLTFSFVLMACFSVFMLWQFGRDLPDYYFFLNYTPPTITRLYDRLGTPLQEFSEERRIYTHLSDIPPILVRAFIAAEDKNFYDHCGIDFLGLIKAVILNTQHKRWKSGPIGGSTITQQVAKMFVVGNEHNLARKIKEAIVALRLESALNKDRILELYLNKVYLGLGSYGVTTAAQTYFNKCLPDLSLADVAFLASLPKTPSHNKNRYEKALNRRNWVLQRMKQNNAISSADYKVAVKQGMPEFDYSPLHKPQTNAYYVEDARKGLIRLFGEKATYNAGIEATLTIHPQIQKITEESLRYALEQYDVRHGWRGPIGHVDVSTSWAPVLERMQVCGIKMIPAVILSSLPQIEIGLPNGKRARLSAGAFPNAKIRTGDIVYVKNHNDRWELSQIPEVTGGMVVLDAKSGEILGMSGGYSFELSQFNCATQALRQPGSAFKPFVYLAALEEGFNSNSIINEKPVSIPIPGGFYTPHNYCKHVYGGPTPMCMGLIKSRNVLTVILAHKIGIKCVTALAQRLGVAEYIPNWLCVALGAHETSVVKLAGAYATFFNGGKIVKPTLFLQVSSLLGSKDVVYLHQLSTKSNVFEVVSYSAPNWENEASQDSNIKTRSINQMKDILARCVTQGTGRDLAHWMQRYPIKLYGKTGTSNDFKDAWFAGAIEGTGPWLKPGRPLVFVVFIGFPTPRTLGAHEHGARVAIPAINHFIPALFSPLQN